ncbi:MAG: glycogen synthase [Ignavibacteria bacterium]|nr:glycogen synthase [Ignavibacteria bacterium]
MNILVTAAEVAPYAKVGGLADMTGALPKAWGAAGHDVKVVLPMYGTIDADKYSLTQLEGELTVPFAGHTEQATVLEGKLPGSDVPAYFIRSADYYDRPGIYGYHEGFEDNDRRFIFLCSAAFELAKALNWSPDIIHAHDYHTAMMMPMLKITRQSDPHFANSAGVFTIHNMAYQGTFDPQRAMTFANFNPDEFYSGCWHEQDGAFNAMKSAIMFADKITTVSPTYAQEIQWTPEGMGLQSSLQARGSDLIGLLNGIDPSVWSPEIDPFIPVPYSLDTIEKKIIAKTALLKEGGLTDAAIKHDLPLFGMVTRLTEQKGLSLIIDSLEEFVADNRLRIAVLGSGEKRFESYFNDLSRRYPNNVLVGTGYNEPLSHKIQAASDYYLMPSKFEPCGLTQMFALAYGTVPVVRAVGGLNDTVHEYDPVTFTGNGFTFSRYLSGDLRDTINRALRVYKQRAHWDRLRVNAMSSHHWISATAEKYVEVFQWAKERYS